MKLKVSQDVLELFIQTVLRHLGKSFEASQDAFNILASQAKSKLKPKSLEAFKDAFNIYSKCLKTLLMIYSIVS